MDGKKKFLKKKNSILMKSIKLEELIDGPAEEDIKTTKCSPDDYIPDYVRHDRFGNPIFLQKHIHLKFNPNIKPIHKVSFVDQVQQQVLTHEAHPDTKVIEHSNHKNHGKVL